MVLIVGASSGIGAATARLLTRAGAALALLSRSEAALQSVAATIAGPVLVVPADITDAAALEATISVVLARYGRLDAVVHTAQVMAHGRIEDVPRPVFEHVVAVAMHGTANLARLVLPAFRSQHHGTLVIVSSLLGEIATPRMGAYDAAKWGQLGLARVLQLEARETSGVNVCLVSPGAVDTPIYDQAANYAGRAGFPPPPVISPHVVAKAIYGCLRRPRSHVEVPGYEPADGSGIPPGSSAVPADRRATG